MCKVMSFAFSLALALLVVPPASAQPRCQKSDVWANGAPAALNSVARRRARAAWLAGVRSKLGEAYSNWSRAKDRRTTCLGNQRQYTCTVSARPCRA
jgi:hypothetical protein